MKQETLSNSESPKVKLALEDKYKEQDKKEAAERVDHTNIENVVDELPTPSGWRLLVLPFKLRIAVNCGYVLKMGPLAYKDEEKFSTGPWCKEKDWVIFARYAGSRLPIKGGEVRILNDDEVLGTIPDPEAILHYI
jgi:co-chaperonin GroES (HSP10)